MSHTIYPGEFDDPMLQINIGDRSIGFTLEGIPAEKHEWLANSIERQVQDLIDIRVREALEAHKRELRKLLGVN